MKKCGFIGYGSMGSMLVNGFLASGTVTPDQIGISNRTMTKIESLRLQWADITITSDNRKVARESDLLFVCVKPLDFSTVLYEIKSNLTELTHLVSIAACVTINDIERQFSGPITKIIPSLTSEVNEGISLVCHNSKVSENQKKILENLLGSVSKVVQVKETDFEAAADLTSCAPGMIAAIFDNFVHAGIRHSDIPPEVAHQMVVSTLFGTAKLLTERGIDFSEMIRRVATKGGITEEGVKVLNRHLPEVFDEVFSKTLSKHDLIKEKIAKLGITNASRGTRE
ncbi:MAG TPA: pyrroline-5-carboxylate reductase dimerization domain-containing protein [Candidatus Brocadiaceae bacterium]